MVRATVSILNLEASGCPKPCTKTLYPKMSNEAKLILIKSLHTLIWIFFNVVIFYFLYAVIINQIDHWVWICIGFLALESVVLLVCRSVCPVTLLARKYSDSEKPNFDIYLPGWLAKYNKLIYISIVALAIVILIYRLRMK
jgi:hypothetical protein